MRRNMIKSRILKEQMKGTLMGIGPLVLLNLGKVLRKLSLHSKIMSRDRNQPR